MEEKLIQLNIQDAIEHPYDKPNATPGKYLLAARAVVACMNRKIGLGDCFDKVSIENREALIKELTSTIEYIVEKT